MYISDSKALTTAINKLSNQCITEENILLDKMHAIRKFLDPVYQVNKILPCKVKAAEMLNRLMDDSIVYGAHAISAKLGGQSKDSLLKQTGSNFLRLTVSKIINHNAHKIKLMSLAVIKNIFIS